MGLLDDIMAADAEHGFADTDAFAEQVTYTPSGGSGRTINAVVVREPPMLVDGDPEPHKYPQYRVTVRNDSTYGIASTEVNLHGDTVSLSRRWGESTSARVVSHVVSQDAGMMELALL